MAVTAWFPARVHVNTTVKLMRFYQEKNEEPVRYFICNIIESRAELKYLSVHEIKAKDVMCSFNMRMWVLFQRRLFDLDVNMTQDIKEKATNPENGTN